MRDLDAAGISGADLRASYQSCRRSNARHGRTYYLATRLLPAHKRPYVHALYAFARHADDVVDDLTAPPGQKAERLHEWSARFFAGTDADPILPAVHHTIERWRLPRHHFTAFLESMGRDLTEDGYDTYDDLLGYMYGSAAVIGLQMLPILEPLPGSEDRAGRCAQDLGLAFQLSNFLRDVGEDLQRGRVYLPREDLDRFGVTRADLATRRVDDRVRRLLAFEISRTRALYRAAAPGVALLHETSRDCVRTATVLYGEILDQVERADYQVLDRRVAVPLPRRAAVALPALIRASRSRRRADQSRPRRPSHTHQAKVDRTSANPKSRSSTGA